MSDIRELLAEAISHSIDTRMGVLELEDPTRQDYELADDLLARFEITPSHNTQGDEQ